jgi:hypothetical protein
MVFRQTAVAYLLEAEDSFEDAERMFDLRPHTRLTLVLSVLYLVHVALVSGSVGHILSPGCGLLDRFGLALVASVASHLALLPCSRFGRTRSLPHWPPSSPVSGP